MLQKILYISLEPAYLSIHVYEMINAMIAEGVKVDLMCLNDAKGLGNLNNNVQKLLIYNGSKLSRLRLLLKVVNNLRHYLKSGYNLVYNRQNIHHFILPIITRIYGYPYWAELNHCAASASYNSHWLRRLILHGMEWLVLFCASHIVVPSKALANVILHTYPTLAKQLSKKLSVIPNAANTRLFHPIAKPNLRKKLGLKPNISLIGFVGSLLPWQGVETFIESFSTLTEMGSRARFLVVGGYDVYGESETRRRLETCKDYSRVLFKGKVSYSESALWMAACDVLVTPLTPTYSRHGGGSPMKVYAYLASGRPIVLSAIDGWTEHEWIVDQGAGLSVPPDNPTALAEALHSLLTDEGKRLKMGKQAREIAEHSHDWRHRAKKLIEIINQDIRCAAS